MCAVLYCGFPSLGDTMAAYPALLPHDQKAFIKGVKVVDFHKHLRYVLRARTFLVIIIVVVYGKDFFFHEDVLFVLVRTLYNFRIST